MVLRFKNALQVLECYSPTSSQTRVLIVQASVAAYLQDLPSRFFSYELLNARKQKKYYQRATYEDKISMFPQPSTALSFKKLIISMPSLLRGLHTMSILKSLKSVPERLKPRECKRTKLVSHRLSPTYLRRMRYKKRLQN